MASFWAHFGSKNLLKIIKKINKKNRRFLDAILVPKWCQKASQSQWKILQKRSKKSIKKTTWFSHDVLAKFMKKSTSGDKKTLIFYYNLQYILAVAIFQWWTKWIWFSLTFPWFFTPKCPPKPSKSPSEINERII